MKEVAAVLGFKESGSSGHRGLATGLTHLDVPASQQEGLAHKGYPQNAFFIDLNFGKWTFQEVSGLSTTQKDSVRN